MSGPSATGRERGDRNGSGVEFPLAAGFRLDKARDQHIGLGSGIYASQ
jgi:hypothetical protein